MIMTDLTDKGFARREEALNFDDACAALDWLARLHGIMTNPIVTSAQIHLVSADGLWEQGTYWNLGKRNAVKQLTAGVMEAHWRARALARGLYRHRRRRRLPQAAVRRRRAD